MYLIKVTLNLKAQTFPPSKESIKTLQVIVKVVFTFEFMVLSF
jgi:hypothetical protein